MLEAWTHGPVKELARTGTRRRFFAASEHKQSGKVVVVVGETPDETQAKRERELMVMA